MKTQNSTVEIDGVRYEVAPQVAALLQAVSEERDQLMAKAQVCMDLHEALGVSWGNDPYAEIRRLRKLIADLRDGLRVEAERSCERRLWKS